MSLRFDSEDSNGSSGFFNPQRSFVVKNNEGHSSKNKKDLNLLGDSNFLCNFNPENSKREQAKMKRQTYNKPTAKPKSSIDRTSMYDEFGLTRIKREDVCDCFDLACDGCHFPCLKCGSPKCSIKCRVNRKFAYETIQLDGKDLHLEINPLVSNTDYRHNV